MKTIIPKLTIFLGTTAFLIILFTITVQAQKFNFSASNVLIDEANMLDSYERTTLSMKIENHNEKGPGNVFVLLTTNLPKDISIENYSLQLLAEIEGSAKTTQSDGSILLVVSLWDKEVLIQMSDGARSLLSKNESDSITRNSIMPKFKTHDYYSGINDGIANLIKALEK